MRYLNILLGLLLLGFAAVQLNDPDGPLWMVFYLIGAIWALLAALRPAVLRSGAGRGLLWACITAAVAGVIYYWPQMPNFWLTEVFWEEETAREGMGVMILLVVLLAALIGSRAKQQAIRA